MPHHDKSNSNADQSPEEPRQSNIERPAPRKQNQIIPDKIEKYKTNKQSQSWPTKVQAVTTVLILIATSLYVYFAYGQLTEMRKTVSGSAESIKNTLSKMDDQTAAMDRLAGANEAAVKLTKRSMEYTLRQMKAQTTIMQRAAKANEKAVKLAERSLKATQEQTRLDERAWVGMTGVDSHAEIGKPFQIRIGFTNTGKTPAKNACTKCLVEYKKGTEEPNFTKIDTIVSDSQGIIMPGQRVFADLTCDFLSASFQGEIHQGRARMFLYGTIKYDDVFKRHHFLKYCFMLEPDCSGWNIYSHHNDTDNN